MGGGESKYVEDQERFVRANLSQFKEALGKNYGEGQIKGKLRQLYASTDTHDRNKHSYILSYEWNKAKTKVTPIYNSRAEAEGSRRYY
jgi:hypothetical protein